MTNQSSGKQPSIEIGRLKVWGHPAVLEALETKATRDEIQLDDSARYALGVGLSRPVGQDLKREGYTVLAEIGPPRQLKPENMTELAEDVAATIDKIRRLVGRTELTLVLSCPVALAFMVGTLLSHTQNLRLVHWDGHYAEVPAPDIAKFRKKSREEL